MFEIEAEVQFAVLQVSCDGLPYATEFGFAVKLLMWQACWRTVTTTDDDTEPDAPYAVKTYVVVPKSAPVETDPVVATEPIPEMVAEVQLEVLHESDDAIPEATCVGFA